MALKTRARKQRPLSEASPDFVPDYSADVQKYIDGVLSGRTVAGREQRLAVLRHVADLKHAGKRGWFFNATVASWCIWWIETHCVHTKNSVGAKAGDPITLSPTQRFIIWNLFGWRDDDGYRRYRKAHIEVARKFGKSTFVACVLLMCLVFDVPADGNAELYCVATKIDQARIVWREARAMIRRSRSLRRRLICRSQSIMLKSDDSFLKCVASSGAELDGLNGSIIVKDELHAWGKKHREANEKLDTGDGSRLQPLSIAITTAGTERSLIWKEERDEALRAIESVITGEIQDDRLFAFICCIDMVDHACPLCSGTGKTKAGKVTRKCGGCRAGTVAKDDPFSPGIWPKANPNLGISVAVEKYAAKASRARRDPSYLHVFLRYYCNVQVSSTEKAVPLEVWAACSGPPFVAPGQFCRGACDLGRTDDFAAWVLVFPSILDAQDEDNRDVLRTYDIISRSYTCEARAEKLQLPKLDEWIEKGLIECHPGDQVDFGEIERDLCDMSELYQVISWGFDATFAPQMIQRMINLHGHPAHKFAQASSWYNPAVIELRKALKRRDVSHGGCPVLAWQIDNLIYKRDAKDLCMPDKASSAFKIDAAVALHMALGDILFHAADDESRVSVYESQGLRSV